MAGFSNLVFFIGVVENNYDERLEGRVQVRAFGFHGTVDQIPTRDLPWAIPIATGYDVNYPIPPLNSWVFGFFMDGHAAQQPMLLGIMPTQFVEPINPEVNGWGVIDAMDYDIRAKGFRPQDAGQPQNSRLARGENLEQTYNSDVEITKVSDVVSSSGETWSEPGSAYRARYPYNRVIETASGHSIELDDTPGGERIMIYHNSGSYVQVDPVGTSTYKSTGDKFDVNESNMHVYVGGKSDVTILGDCYLRVEGSRSEEIMGDSRTIVHGNYELNVGGFANMNVSDEMQMRGARVALEAKVEDVNILAAKNLNMTGKKSASVNSEKSVSVQSNEVLGIKSQNTSMESETAINMKSERINIGGGSKISLNASLVSIDDYVNLSTGDSDEPESSFDGVIADSVQMTEPTSKSVSGIATIGGGGGSGGGSAGVVGPTSFEGIPEDFSSSFTSDCSTDLVDSLKTEERFSPKAYWDYKQWSIGYGIATDNPNEVISEEEATRRLAARVSTDRNYVASYGRSRGYNWNDCQVDALTSFVYNLGRGQLENVTASGRRSNDEIARAMLEYNGTVKNGVKQVLPGLVKRRRSESDWFKSGSGIKVEPDVNDDGVMV